MRLTTLKLSKKEIIDIDNLKLFLRLEDDNSLDGEIYSLLNSAITEFETRTNRILRNGEYEIKLFKERFLTAPFNNIINADFKGLMQSNDSMLFLEGSGELVANLGYEVLPNDIELWIKNYIALGLENSALPSISANLIRLYKIRAF